MDDSRQVAIVTDSSASLPDELVEREGIIVVPISVVFDGETCRDGTLSAAEFYARLKSAKKPMTTSPAPSEFIEAFKKARDCGAREVLCLIMSSRLSGTFRVAQTAAEMTSEELPGFPVRAVDTGGLAMVHGFAVLAAAEALQSGATAEEAAAAATRVGSRGELVGALDTLRYLARGGRVPWVVHWAAAVLRIKPVLAWRQGEARAVARTRTMGRALDRVVDYVAERAGDGELRVAVMHANAPNRAQALMRRMRERLSVGDVMITEFTSGMGVHTGPGFAGLAFYTR